ncbi:MAG: thioredoxin family protein [Planctomycetes bacterium]|nr:thioredoxin family protein [Planctomycetota bacterium]
MRYFAILFLSAWMPLAAFSLASAQTFNEPPRSSDRFSEGIIGQFDSSSDIGLEPATLKAQLAPATVEHPAVLMLTAKIAAGRHTYSITQPSGGPLPTRILLDPSKDYRLLGEFRATPAPNSRIEQGPVWTGLEIQEHEGQVTWYAPLELSAGVAPAKLEVEGTVHMEVCQTGGYCEPVEKAFTAKLANDIKLPSIIATDLRKSVSSSPAAAGKEFTRRGGQSEIRWSNGTFQPESSAVKFTGQLVPSAVQPGDTAELKFTATSPKGSRIYAYSARDDRPGTKPMLIAINHASGLIPHRPTTDAPVKTDDSVPEFGRMQYHEGEVTWAVRVDVPKNAPPGDYAINGLIGYQACEYRDDGKNICELPHAVRFETTLTVGDTKTVASAPIRFAPGRNYSDVARLAGTFANFLDGTSTGPTSSAPKASNTAQTKNTAADVPVLSATDQYDLNQVQIDEAAGSIGHYLALAFVGGLILNLMPCVLPVIGLKVMSFVEQAGKSRAHALVLNLWYSAGIVSVFLLLGLLAATIGLSWGGQFGSTAFNVSIASVVFAMALSLLGVWEVPIPGFFGSGSIHKAAAQEGPVGAFLKGVVTTVLATPCTAPFMAAAVAWAVTQSLGTTLLVFASLGIGMASPYVLIGVWPELLRFLPKPGGWMETFKQISGFVLLATVVFILSFIEPAAVVPTILLLLGIAFACWLVARTPLTAEFRDRVWAWSGAGAVILVFIAASFGWLYRIAGAPADPSWQPFSLEKLKQVAVDEGRTVLVDFSAEWCINCKFFEQTVLHTRPVEQAIANTGVVTMYADYTNYPEEIRRTLKALRANGVPVIAIFPGNAPYYPIVFGGGYTKQGLIAALQRATGGRAQSPGQSVAEAAATAAPMN